MLAWARRFKWWLIATGVALVIGALVFGAMATLSLFPPSTKDFGEVSLSVISEDTGVRFPEGSRLLRSSDFEWQGAEISAKIVLRPDRVQEFLASLPQRGEVSSTHHLGVLQGPHDPKWWSPDRSRQFVAVHYRWDPKDVKPGSTDYTQGDMSLLIAYDQGTSPVLYLDWDAG